MSAPSPMPTGSTTSPSSSSGRPGSRRARAARLLLVGVLSTTTAVIGVPAAANAATAPEPAATSEAVAHPATGPGIVHSGAACSDVEVLHARGTNPVQGLGLIGLDFVKTLTGILPHQNVTYYDVVYAAAADHSSVGAGATNLTRHLVTRAAACPHTQFVISGYSQGAAVVDVALGIPMGLAIGQQIPGHLEHRIAAVVVFGNSVGHHQGATIAQLVPALQGRAKDFCNRLDPVCAPQAPTGWGDHSSYPLNGSALEAARYVARRVR